jgi:exodeoxyribonuclease V gamma subunit
MFSATLSNQWDLLLELCKAKLLKRKPFDLCLVIVPGLPMKNGFLRAIANDPSFGAAFGLKVLSFNEAIHWLLESPGKHLPHPMQLALAIDCELQQMHQEERPYDALEIADLFQRYGEFAPEEVESWTSSDPEWQKRLWFKLFGPDSPLQPLYRFLSSAKMRQSLAQIHLFGFSCLTLVKHRFLLELSGNVPVYSWVASPSRMLLSDLGSKQWRFAEAEWFEEDNPLIANNGKLGRSWQKELEELPDIQERFSLPLAVTNHPAYSSALIDGIDIASGGTFSLLSAVQADLLLLRSSKELVELPSEDRSIEIHSAASIQREVEILHQVLLRTLSSSTSLQPSDIRVFVPQIEKYAPFIRSIFADPDQPICVEIAEQESLLDQPSTRILFQLLELAESRWELKQVLELMQQPQMRLPNPIALDEIREMGELFERQGIYWGRSGVHRKEGEAGSWDWGWEELVKSLGCLTSPEDFLQNSSLSTVAIAPISFSCAELLGAMIENVQTFHRDLAAFASKERKKVSDWSSLVLELMERYLHEDEVAFSDLKGILNQLRKWDQGSHLSLSSFAIYFKEMCKDHRTPLRERQLNAVHFVSSQTFRIAPASVIAVMGLNGEEFPRPRRRSAFDCLENPSVIPSSADEDRYFFLESLVTAKEKWILSYVSTSNEPPSVLIQELLQYLDTRYTMGGQRPSEKIHSQHPRFAFDSKNSLFSCRAHRTAQAILTPPDDSCGSFFLPPISPERYCLDLMPQHLNLSELKKALFNPLKHYMNQRLNLYLRIPSLPHPLFEELEEDDFWDRECLKWALRYPIDRISALAERMGKLPIAPWRSVSKERLQNKLEELLKGLQEMGIQPEEVFEVEFCHGMASFTQVNAFRWQAPPLTISYRGRKIEMTGVLPYVCAKGLLSPQELKKDSAVKSLPERMFHQAIQKESEQTMLYLKNQKSEAHGRLPSWDLFLDHYLCTLHQPAPLLPPWVKPILDSSPSQLAKAIQQTFHQNFFDDPYLKGLTPQTDKMNPQEIIASWNEYAQQLFGLGEDL